MVRMILDGTNIPYYHYGNIERGNGMIITVGSGMLMASMDLVKSARYALEWKDIKDNKELSFAINICCSFIDYIAIIAWFSVTNPLEMGKFLLDIPEKMLYIYSNFDFKIGHKIDSLKQLENILNHVKNNHISS